MTDAPDLASIVARRAAAVDAVLASCLDVTAVWSISHEPDAQEGESEDISLLVFATGQVLERLRKCDSLHDERVEVLVVVDGDHFAAAWGPEWRSGSLARLAWRQTSAGEAFYDESRWSHGAQDDGAVARVRRRAFRLWPAQGGTAPAKGV